MVPSLQVFIQNLNSHHKWIHVVAIHIIAKPQSPRAKCFITAKIFLRKTILCNGLVNLIKHLLNWGYCEQQLNSEIHWALTILREKCGNNNWTKIRLLAYCWWSHTIQFYHLFNRFPSTIFQSFTPWKSHVGHACFPHRWPSTTQEAWRLFGSSDADLHLSNVSNIDSRKRIYQLLDWTDI